MSDSLLRSDASPSRRTGHARGTNVGRAGDHAGSAIKGAGMARAASGPRPTRKGRGRSSSTGVATEAPRRKPYSVRLVTAAAFLLPGSGQMLNGDPIRAIVMQFFMMFLAYITYTQTGPEISFIGRFAGGIFIYVITVLDAYTVATRRNRAWARMVADGTVEDESPRRRGPRAP